MKKILLWLATFALAGQLADGQEDQTTALGGTGSQAAFQKAFQFANCEGQWVDGAVVVQLKPAADANNPAARAHVVFLTGENDWSPFLSFQFEAEWKADKELILAVDYLNSSDKATTEHLSVSPNRVYHPSLSGFRVENWASDIRKVRFSVDTSKLTGEATLRLKGFNSFCLALEAYQQAGFSGPIFYLMDSAPMEKVALTRGPWFSNEFKHAIQSIARGLVAEGKKRGWPDLIIQPYDEVSYEAGPVNEKQKQALFIYQAFKEAGLTTEVDGASPTEPGYEFARTVLPLVDVLVVGSGRYFPSLDETSAWHANGKRFMYYNMDETGFHPEMMRYYAGFLTWLRNTDGILNWAYRNPGHPYDDFRDVSPQVAFNFNFAPEYGLPGGNTIAWEAYRDGVDDYRYLVTLANLIQKLRHSGQSGAEIKATEALKELNEILQTLRWPTGVNTVELSRWRRDLVDQESGPLCCGSWLATFWKNGFYLEPIRSRRRRGSAAARLACTIPT